MAKRMLIDAGHDNEQRVVVLEGDKLIEADFQSSAKTQIKGNVYLARVTRVEPSLQAAFVDFGNGKHGFLPFSEIHPDYFQIPVADREALLEEVQNALSKRQVNTEQVNTDTAADNTNADDPDGNETDQNGAKQSSQNPLETSQSDAVSKSGATTAKGKADDAEKPKRGRRKPPAKKAAQPAEGGGKVQPAEGGGKVAVEGESQAETAPQPAAVSQDGQASQRPETQNAEGKTDRPKRGRRKPSAKTAQTSVVEVQSETPPQPTTDPTTDPENASAQSASQDAPESEGKAAQGEKPKRVRRKAPAKKAAQSADSQSDDAQLSEPQPTEPQFTFEKQP